MVRSARSVPVCEDCRGADAAAIVDGRRLCGGCALDAERGESR